MEPTRKRRLALVAVLGIVVLALDLWSKAWAWHELRGEKQIGRAHV